MLVLSCGDGAVEPPPPAPAPVATTVTVNPASATLTALEETARFTADVRDQNGQVMAGAAVAWTTSDASVASVDASGLVTAAANGGATITATAGSISRTAEVTVAQEIATVTVTPPADTLVTGDAVQLMAEAADANGHTVAGVEFSWASSDTSVAAVDATGLVTSVGTGEATVTATASGITGGAVLTVVAPVPMSVAVVPDTVVLTALGQTAQLSAEVRDQTGNAMPGAPVTWSSSDAAVAAVNAVGLVTAVGNGTAAITAAAGSARGTARITVAAPPHAPPYRGTAYLDPDIIVPSDPTDFVDLEPAGRGERLVYDRRAGAWITIRAYLFDATFANERSAEFQVNPEFGTWAEAEAAARDYAPAIGQIPVALREDMDAVWIHRGDEPFGGGNRALLVHTDRGEKYREREILPEILVHEGVHTSLDSAHADAHGWLAAQAADPTFISTYARDYPDREDLAESFSAWLAVRHRRDRITEGMADTITAAIPNRLAYFDSLDLNICPVVTGGACDARARWELSGTVTELLQRFIDVHAIGAAALGIMNQGEIVYDEAVGYMDAQRQVPARQDMVMRLASVTKPITAAAIHKLASDGMLALDDRVFDLGRTGDGLLQIDPFPQLGDARLAEITVLHLLQHRGGWDREVAPDFAFREIEIASALSVASPPGRENTVRFVLGQPLQFSPGSRRAYSNIGYLVLGLVIEEASGRDYMTYVLENIFDPLGVPRDDVVQGRTFPDDRSDREPWYDGIRRCRNVFDPSGPDVRCPEGGWDHEAKIAHGGMAASTRAILAFVEAYQVAGDNIGRRRRGGEGPGWWWYHTGSLDGTNTLALQRGNGTGYVVLFNRRLQPSSGPSYVELFMEVIENQLGEHASARYGVAAAVAGEADSDGGYVLLSRGVPVAAGRGSR
ncbi:MAG: serine hydrolase [Gammaproteobacteria bacterium]|nr:serine hydrolase [Gammaproteobacteria bacterium]